MSSFRLICIATLINAMVGFVAGAAAAQSATATDQSGKPYLAGLHPPHEHHKTGACENEPRQRPTQGNNKNRADGNETTADRGREFEGPSAGAPCRQNKFACRLAER